jgi:hypothetical protein
MFCTVEVFESNKRQIIRIVRIVRVVRVVREI